MSVPNVTLVVLYYNTFYANYGYKYKQTNLK